MQARVFIPLIDLAFLSLAAIIGILSQTQLIRSFAVEITEVGQGISAITREEVTVFTLTVDGLFVDGRPVEVKEVADTVNGRLALLRVDRNVATSVLVKVMGHLAANGTELRIEVRQEAPGST